MLQKLSTWLSERSLPPIVVGGTGGSGTRVVQALLSDVGVYMGKALNQPGDAMQFEPLLDEKINPVLELVRGLDYAPDAITPALRKEIIQAIRATAALYLEDRPKDISLWGWKNPRSMFLLPLIHSVFPKLYFIHVVRDGRDMAFSKNQNQPHKHYQALFGQAYSANAPEKAAIQAIELWSKANLDAAEFGARALGERYIRVRFEDICAEPEKESRRLFGLLGLATTPSAEALQAIEKPNTVGRFQEEAEMLEAVTKAGAASLKAFGYI